MAESKIYTSRESPILFADSVQTPAATLTLSALASGAGRVSARYDRGAGSIATTYEWRLNWSLSGTNVLLAAAEIWVFTSDGTNQDGIVGTIDAALATGQRNAGKPAGLALVTQTTTNTVMTSSGYVSVLSRYLSIGVWNATTLAFQTSTSAHQLYLIPVPDAAQ
jgi:hypothetical protein